MIKSLSCCVAVACCGVAFWTSSVSAQSVSAPAQSRTDSIEAKCQSIGLQFAALEQQIAELLNRARAATATTVALTSAGGEFDCQAAAASTAPATVTCGTAPSAVAKSDGEGCCKFMALAAKLSDAKVSIASCGESKVAVAQEDCTTKTAKTCDAGTFMLGVVGRSSDETACAKQPVTVEGCKTTEATRIAATGPDCCALKVKVATACATPAGAISIGCDKSADTKVAAASGGTWTIGSAPSSAACGSTVVASPAGQACGSMVAKSSDCCKTAKANPVSAAKDDCCGKAKVAAAACAPTAAGAPAAACAPSSAACGSTAVASPAGQACDSMVAKSSDCCKTAKTNPVSAAKDDCCSKAKVAATTDAEACAPASCSPVAGAPGAATCVMLVDDTTCRVVAGVPISISSAAGCCKTAPTQAAAADSTCVVQLTCGAAPIASTAPQDCCKTKGQASAADDCCKTTKAGVDAACSSMPGECATTRVLMLGSGGAICVAQPCVVAPGCEPAACAVGTGYMPATVSAVAHPVGCCLHGSAAVTIHCAPKQQVSMSCAPMSCNGQGVSTCESTRVVMPGCCSQMQAQPMRVQMIQRSSAPAPVAKSACCKTGQPEQQCPPAPVATPKSGCCKEAGATKTATPVAPKCAEEAPNPVSAPILFRYKSADAPASAGACCGTKIVKP